MRRKVRQARLQKGERQAARGKKHSSPSQCLALEGPQFWKQRSAQVAAGPKTPSGLHCHGVWDWPAHGFNYQQQGARNYHHHGACNVRHRQPRPKDRPAFTLMEFGTGEPTVLFGATVSYSFRKLQSENVELVSCRCTKQR